MSSHVASIRNKFSISSPNFLRTRMEKRRKRVAHSQKQRQDSFKALQRTSKAQSKQGSRDIFTADLVGEDLKSVQQQIKELSTSIDITARAGSERTKDLEKFLTEKIEESFEKQNQLVLEELGKIRADLASLRLDVEKRLENMGLAVETLHHWVRLPRSVIRPSKDSEISSQVGVSFEQLREKIRQKGAEAVTSTQSIMSSTPVAGANSINWSTVETTIISPAPSPHNSPPRESRSSLTVSTPVTTKEEDEDDWQLPGQNTTSPRSFIPLPPPMSIPPIQMTTTRPLQTRAKRYENQTLRRDYGKQLKGSPYVDFPMRR